MARPIPPYIFSDDFANRKNIAWRIEPGTWDAANPLVFRGDEKLYTYTWGGRDHLPDNAAVRFCLKRAGLYGFDIR